MPLLHMLPDNPVPLIGMAVVLFSMVATLQNHVSAHAGCFCGQVWRQCEGAVCGLWRPQPEGVRRATSSDLNVTLCGW